MDTTRRYPRTMVEAFGPYADRGPIVEMQPRRSLVARLLAALGRLLGVTP